MSSLKDNASKYLSKIAGFVGAIPPIPSGEDKNLLRQLEKMKVGDPFDEVYGVEKRKPHISGAKPEKIGVEVRVKRNKHAITYWYYWSHDRFWGDHEDWEPVTLVFEHDKLIRVDSRVHDELVSCEPFLKDDKITVFFPRVGHTPTVRVSNKSAIKFRHHKYVWNKYLDSCYDRAKSNKWKIISQPNLTKNAAPRLDRKKWREWGKHAAYTEL